MEGTSQYGSTLSRETSESYLKEILECISDHEEESDSQELEVEP